MNRAELEHAIRAACDALAVPEVIVVGSQSILGVFPDAPRELRMSAEADIWHEGAGEGPGEDALNSLGFGSHFHQEFGFYIDPVGPETAALPEGWRARAVTIEIEGRDARGLCLEAHDLPVSKLARGVEKDLAFVAAMLYHRMIRASVVEHRIETLPEVSDAARAHTLAGLHSALGRATERRRKREGRDAGEGQRR